MEYDNNYVIIPMNKAIQYTTAKNVDIKTESSNYLEFHKSISGKSTNHSSNSTKRKIESGYVIHKENLFDQTSDFGTVNVEYTVPLFSPKNSNVTDRPLAVNMRRDVILDSEIKNNPTFVLTDYEDGTLLNKETLIINAAGLQKGLRNMRDGYSFFGVVKELVSIYILTLHIL